MNFVTVNEASKLLKLSQDTIRRWAKKGLLQESRSPNNHRLFARDELLRVKKKYLSKIPEGKYKILKSKKTKHTVIELFSGAGGLALGLENAGFNTKLLLDVDKDTVKTLRKNRPKWNVIEDDIKNVSFKKYKGKKHVYIIYVNPSTANS